MSLFQEGPHSTLNEDEFYDAVETGLDKLEEEIMLRERLKQPTLPAKSLTVKATQHRLWSEVSIVSMYLTSFLVYLSSGMLK